MNKKILVSLFLCVVLMSTMVSGSCMEVSATVETELSALDAIKPYADILNEVNQEYGTEFALPTNAVLQQMGMDRNAVIQEIQSTAIEDYETMIRNAYIASITGTSDDTGIDLAAVNVTQKGYYSTGNYVGITAVTYYADSANHYSSITGSCYGHTEIPYYVPYDMSYTIRGSLVDVTYYCYLMLNETVSYNNWKSHVITATFSANGGNTTATIVS